MQVGKVILFGKEARFAIVSALDGVQLARFVRSQMRDKPSAVQAGRRRAVVVVALPGGIAASCDVSGLFRQLTRAG